MSLLCKFLFCFSVGVAVGGGALIIMQQKRKRKTFGFENMFVCQRAELQKWIQKCAAL